jgi:hypothetical protein
LISQPTHDCTPVSTSGAAVPKECWFALSPCRHFEPPRAACPRGGNGMRPIPPPRSRIKVARQWLPVAGRRDQPGRSGQVQHLPVPRDFLRIFASTLRRQLWVSPETARTSRIYCSVACRSRAYRGRRGALQLQAQGKSLIEIARELGSTVDTVTGWLSRQKKEG